MSSSRWFSAWCLVLAGVTFSVVGPARAQRTVAAEQAPRTSAATRTQRAARVELLLAGPGEDIFARFGHVAFLVRGAGRPVVYNYGYTDFTDPDLIFSFLRGRSRFWLATEGLVATRGVYRHQDRSLALQPLRLTESQHQELARLLAWNARREHRYYVYHHFTDNCSTRLRDLLNQVTGGRLFREWRGVPTGDTLRDFVRQGFAGRIEILALSDLLLGRVVDQPVDLWAGAFLPRILSAALQRHGAAQPLASAPRVLYRRQQPSPLAHQPLAGTGLLWGVAGLILLLGVVMAWRAPSLGRWASLSLGLAAAFLGACAALVWGVALVATLPELRGNELLLLLWPTDLLLLGVATRWWQGRALRRRWLTSYAALRLAVATVVVVGHLSGFLIQRPLCWVAMVWVLFAGILISQLRSPLRPVLETAGEAEAAEEAEADTATEATEAEAETATEAEAAGEAEAEVTTESWR